MRLVRKWVFWSASTVLLGALVLALVASLLPRGHIGEAAAEEPGPSSADSEAGAVTVRTIRPKCDPSFSLSVKAPAQVAPYEWADLEAQVAGTVEFIRKAEGSQVTAGELLLKIAVPDLDEELKQKGITIRQRVAEWKLAQANEATAHSAVSVAATSIEVAGASVDVAEAIRDFRGKELKRLRGLLEDKAAVGQVVEEQELNYGAALADVKKARALVKKAQADWQEAQAKLGAAKADVQLKKELIDVARKDRDRTQALVEYARITAPFDGVVTKRNVNRGSFVQNATTGHAMPLLRVERQDVVTITMNVPDTFASYVSNDTEALIELSDRPGQAIHARVSRFSPTLESASRDHTMLVEVDLYNGTEAEYQRFLAREKAKKAPFDDLKDGPLPVVPKVTGNNAGDFQRLYPDMYGEMRLIFRHLPNTYLLPSDAIVRQGGTPYIYLLKEGKAVLVPIEVQTDDQHLAKIAVLEKTANGVIKRGLTGAEEVIYSNQSELANGEAIKPIPQDWTPQD